MNTLDSLAACLPPVAYDDKGDELTRELGAVSELLDEAIASADTVVVEQQPNLANLGLADWERNYALPDRALGPGGNSVGVRRSNLIARITAKGNLSRSHMIELAAVVGFPGATITEYPVFTCQDPCDQNVNDETWIGAWQMDVPASTANQNLLRRVIERRKPAHTIAYINFET